ncbi:MAG: rcp1 3 [Ferruginibacter sp.]|uniref:response regulator n=1 Tax=Ferruginibacter sp. TaxID=1940288 RepID=UPI00265B64D1|nr:response regulator [Ferruginibacter sp.]MDB5276329.1 rcp1 3 [Ferruginibacter sp.]
MTHNARYILMVDDDEDDQMLFREALKQVDNSVRCDTAINGADALQKLQSIPSPDMIFLDLNMPIMNGFECLQALKKEQFYRDIPVIIFTTANDTATIEKSRKLGAAAFFHKPIDFDLFRAKLRQIVVGLPPSPKHPFSMRDFII